MEAAGQLRLALEVLEQAYEEGQMNRDSVVALLRLAAKASLSRLVELETARLPESYAFRRRHRRPALRSLGRAA
jgi:hypothetical protein